MSQAGHQRTGSRSDMSAHFSRSVASVKNYTSQFEDQVARPALGVAAELFGYRPVLTTFLTTLAALSFFPILTFLVVSALTVVTLVSSALILSVAAAFTAVLTFFGLLLSVVIGSAFVAAIITILLLLSYLVVRLLYLIRSDGLSEGFSAWAGELWVYIASVLAGVQQTLDWKTSPSGDRDTTHDAHSDTSNESAVIVHGGDDSTQEGKIAESSSEDAVKVKGS